MNSHEIVVRRNQFYQKILYWQVFLLFLLLLGLYLNFMIFKDIRRSTLKPVYFMTDKFGRYLEDQPRSLPIYSNTVIEEWANKHLVNLLELNFVGYKQKLNKASAVFNPIGYVDYMRALQQTRLITALLAHKYSTIVEVIEPLKVSKTYVFRDTYTWILKGNMMLHYVNQKNINNPFNQELALTVVVIRESFYFYENGISLMTVIA
jgi:hypothetical protein